MEPKNLGETVRIDLESKGRFGNPESLYLKDFTGGHLNAIVTSRPEEVLETLCSCLNECVVEPKGFNVTELTLDEWYEVMLGMKVQFDSPNYEYTWECECGADNMMVLNLSEVQNRSIDDVDNDVRNALLDYYKSLSEEQAKAWKAQRWPDSDKDIETLIADVLPKEPFWFPNGKAKLGYRLMRIKDTVSSFKYANKVIEPQIQSLSSLQYGGLKKKQNKSGKKVQKERLEHQRGRLAMEYSQAMCLEYIDDGKVSEVKEQEKLALHRNIPSKTLTAILKTYEMMSCGVDHSFDRKCSSCGVVERRWLRQDVSVFELLTFIRDARADSTGKRQESAIPHVLFGI